MKPGDIVVGSFPGAAATKVRPALVLSSALYHRHRPDVILGVITTRIPATLAPTDCLIADWRRAGLHQPSVFRLFLVTLPQSDLRIVGHLSPDDWTAVQNCLRSGLSAL